MAGGSRVGQVAPDFSLTGHDGGTTSLADLRGGPVVLGFIPSPWTTEGASLVGWLRELAARGSGARVLAVSTAGISCLRAWVASLGGLPFPVLSDFWPHGVVTERWGVLDSAGNPLGALFVVDRAGIIAYRAVGRPGSLFDEPAFAAALRGKRVRAGSAGKAPAADGDPGVVMYASTLCPDCRLAREWFRKRRADFREIDIYADEEAAALVRGWAGGKMIVPTFDVGGEVLVGFEPRRLARLLKKKTGPGCGQAPS